MATPVFNSEFEAATVQALEGIHQCLRELVDLVRRDLDGVERHRAQHPEVPTVHIANITPDVKEGS